MRDPRAWWRRNGARITHRWLNPVVGHLAGRRWWYLAALQHTGRRSGRIYRIPVAAQRTRDRREMLIPVTYGMRSAWLRNVLAARGAVVTLHGRRYAVTDPRVVAFADVRADLRAVQRRVLPLLTGEIRWLRLAYVACPDDHAGHPPGDRPRHSPGDGQGDASGGYRPA